MYAQNEACVFYRIRSYVNARTVPMVFYLVVDSDVRKQLVVELGPAISKRAFPISISLPAHLEQLVVAPRPMKDDIMPDFDLLLKRSMLLIDDIVPKFLHGFKSFLEGQNSALVDVEEWIFEDKDGSCFTLEDDYGIIISWKLDGLYKINVPNDESALSESRGKCLECGDDYEEHTKCNCGMDWVLCRYDYDENACFPLLDGNKKELFRCPYYADMQFRVSVQTKASRQCLIKFLDSVGYKKTRPVQETKLVDDEDEDEEDSYY